MEISPLFDLKIVLFLPYLPSKLRWEAEIRYVYLVGALNVVFWSHNFSAPFQPLSAPKKWFYRPAYLFISLPAFLPRLSSHLLVQVLYVPFGVLHFFGPKVSCAPILGRGC